MNEIEQLALRLLNSAENEQGKEPYANLPPSPIGRRYYAVALEARRFAAEKMESLEQWEKYIAHAAWEVRAEVRRMAAELRGETQETTVDAKAEVPSDVWDWEAFLEKTWYEYQANKPSSEPQKSKVRVLAEALASLNLTTARVSDPSMVTVRRDDLAYVMVAYHDLHTKVIGSPLGQSSAAAASVERIEAALAPPKPKCEHRPSETFVHRDGDVFVPCAYCAHERRLGPWQPGDAHADAT